MSIQSEINRISSNVQNTLNTIAATGVEVGEGSDALPAAAAALANEKQDKLTGTQGQVVGFDENGNAVAQEQGSKSSSAAYSVTLTTSGWTLSGDRYYQTVAVAGVTTDTPVVLVDCALDGTDLDADAAVLEAWQGPSANNVAQGAGTLTFYSYDMPTVNIPVNVGVA